VGAAGWRGAWGIPGAPVPQPGPAAPSPCGATADTSLAFSAEDGDASAMAPGPARWLPVPAASLDGARRAAASGGGVRGAGCVAGGPRGSPHAPRSVPLAALAPAGTGQDVR